MLIDLRRCFMTIFQCFLKFRDPTPKRVLKRRQDLLNIGIDFTCETFFGVESLEISGIQPQRNVEKTWLTV